MTCRFDAVVVYDPRPGDTGARHAAAMARALADHGMRVAVVHWFGGASAASAGIDREVEALERHERLVPLAADAPASARIVLAIDLRLFLDPPVRPLNIRASTRVVLVTRRFADTPARARAVIGHCSEALAGTVRLAPVAPSMRSVLETLLPQAETEPSDWPPVLASASTVPETAAPIRAGAPVLGAFRHSRHRPWPNAVETLCALMPAHHLLAYSLFSPPESWVPALRETYRPLSLHAPADASALDRFLNGCDFVVSTDMPEDDPYPEEVVRALDRGVIPILTPDWRMNFLGAAAYCQPRNTGETAVEIFTKPARVKDLRMVWSELRTLHFSPVAFAERLERSLGPLYARPLSSGPSARPARTILSLSSNGIGMGHLTRQLALARRLPPQVTPAFVSFSHAAQMLRDFGYMVEFAPFHAQPRLNSVYWNLQMRAFLETAFAFYRPGAFVVDVNIPFPAIEDLRDSHPEVPFVWVRRAMWGEGRDLAALEKADLFEAVIEPGEFAADYDTGPTAAVRRHVVPVPPLILLDPHEMLDRASAAAMLGIEAETLNVLILPGGQNNFDTSAVWQRLFEELALVPGLRAVFADWAISDRAIRVPPFVRRVRGYPFSRWFRAFDFAVSTAGYNSFTELVSAQLPTIFVPNDNPTMDRQDLRALFAERRGMGLRIRAGEEHRIGEAVRTMCDPGWRADCRAAMAMAPWPDGAARAARIVAGLAEAGRSSAEIVR